MDRTSFTDPGKQEPPVQIRLPYLIHAIDNSLQHFSNEKLTRLKEQ